METRCAISTRSSSRWACTPCRAAGGVLTHGSKPVAGWEHALNPGDSVATVLVDGDMGISAFGTVTYNDGKRVLAFGHPLFNLGPVDMPLAKSEVVLTLASQFQPSKMANATEVVGALRQDRHSGIMGELGATSPMIPVTLKVRSLDAKDAVLDQKDFHFNVFVHQKWTPYLMMLTLYNSISQPERFRRRDHVPPERQGGDERPARYRSLHHAGGRRYADARAHGAGVVAGRQVQPPLPEQRQHARM